MLGVRQGTLMIFSRLTDLRAIDADQAVSLSADSGEISISTPSWMEIRKIGQDRCLKPQLISETSMVPRPRAPVGFLEVEI